MKHEFRRPQHDVLGNIVTLLTLILGVLIAILFTSCASSIPPCPPVTPPEEVLIPVPAPCEDLPVAVAPDRESAGWTADEIRADIAGFLSALSRDYLRLIDTYTANLTTILAHNEACGDEP